MLTHKLNVLDGVSDLAGQLGLYVVVLVGLVHLDVEDGRFARLVSYRSLLHSK